MRQLTKISKCRTDFRCTLIVIYLQFSEVNLVMKIEHKHMVFHWTLRSGERLTKKRCHTAMTQWTSLECNITINYSNNHCVIWGLNVSRVFHWSWLHWPTIFRWNGLIPIVLYYNIMFSTTRNRCGKRAGVAICIWQVSEVRLFTNAI